MKIKRNCKKLNFYFQIEHKSEAALALLNFQTMIKASIVLLFLAISVSSFSQPENKKFEIVGNVSGFQDGTFIRLYDFSTGMNVFWDSAKIIKGKFLFKGTINTAYQKVGIISTDFNNIKTFWLEAGILHFNATIGKFRNAKITGSSMQQEEDKLQRLIQRNPKNEKAINIDYIKNHPNSFISGNILKVYCSTWGKETSKQLYEGLTERVKQSAFGKSIHEYLSLTKDIKVGDKFVDFSLPNFDGKEIALSDYKNKYVLLDFWGSWCAPCREENPNLVKTYNEFKDKGFDILGVSVETNRKAWMDAIHQDGIIWESVSDLKGDDNRAALIYGISSYPTNFLIDPHGIIIAKDLRGEALSKKLSELLK